MTDYERALLSINSANLTANLENMEINQELLQRSRQHEGDNARIVDLLTKILEVLTDDS